MTYTTLITPAQLQALASSGQPHMVFDCSFDLAQPSAGMVQYQEAHIPGALYADLDQHLSAHPGDPAASGGRHPLPSREAFAECCIRGWEGLLDANGKEIVYSSSAAVRLLAFSQSC